MEATLPFLTTFRSMMGHAASVAAVLLSCGPVAHAANTAPTRSFTTHWTCENGRALQINAHPRRPKEEAWVMYAGQRIEVRLGRDAEGPRYASADGKVVWRRNGTDGTLRFEGLLDQPLVCRPGKEQDKPGASSTAR